MITLEPLNYAPTDAEVRTARMVLEFARHEMINALFAKHLTAQIEECPDLVEVVRLVIDDVNRSMNWSDDLIVAAVKRYDTRTDSRPGKENDGEETG